MSDAKRFKESGQKPPKGSYDGVSGRAAPKAAPERTRVAPPQHADVAEIARAVSTGLTVLMLGGLVQPVVTRFVPVLGLIWLILVAVLTFSYVGFRGGRAGPNPPLFGAGTAVGSYLLVVPVLFLVGTFEPISAVSTLAAGAVIGSLAGIVGARTNKGT